MWLSVQKGLLCIYSLPHLLTAAMCRGCVWVLWSRRLCVWLPPRDAQSVPGPAEPRQHSVWWLWLAGPPPVTQASGPEHPAQPVQRQRHPAAVPLLRPPVQPGAAGEPWCRAAPPRALGPVWALTPHRWGPIRTHSDISICCMWLFVYREKSCGCIV